MHPAHPTSCATTRPPAPAACWWPARAWCRRARRPGSPIDDYAWSADGRRLLIFTNTKKVWRRQHARRLLGARPRRTARCTKLGGSAPASSLMFAKFSPDATRVAYVRANNIYVERLSNRPHHPAHDAMDRRPPSTARRTGSTRRSSVSARRVPLEPGRPRHRLLAVRQHRRRHVQPDQQHRLRLSRRHARFRIRRPAPRTPPCGSASSRPTAARRSGCRRRAIRARPTSRAMEWIDNGPARHPAVEPAAEPERLPARRRPQRARRAGCSDDESKAWVDVVDEVQWVDDGRAFLWLSERDGWRHVYRVPREGAGAGTEAAIRG